MQQVLGQVSHVRISARDAHTVLRGRGDVVVSRGPDGSMLVSAAGVWRDGGSAATRFTNASRWTFDGGSIRLANERPGPARAVALVDLGPVGPSRWASRAPHRCGDDLYSARVRVTGDAIILRWRVLGGRKTQLIRLRYE